MVMVVEMLYPNSTTVISISIARSGNRSLLAYQFDQFHYYLTSRLISTTSLIQSKRPKVQRWRYHVHVGTYKVTLAHFRWREFSNAQCTPMHLFSLPKSKTQSYSWALMSGSTRELNWSTNGGPVSLLNEFGLKNRCMNLDSELWTFKGNIWWDMHPDLFFTGIHWSPISIGAKSRSTGRPKEVGKVSYKSSVSRHASAF